MNMYEHDNIHGIDQLEVFCILFMLG